MVDKLKEIYASWELDIVPPPLGPTAGAARQQGGSGLVRYVFAEDEAGKYLEYYSFHRIGGDARARIYEDGRVERLDEIVTSYIITGDAVTDAAAKVRMQQRNERILRELEEAGLLSGGPVPNAFTINTALATGILDPEASTSEELEE